MFHRLAIRRFGLVLLTALALNFVVVDASAHAATYYVATNGNDFNDGSPDSPFRTIQKAVGVVRAGDTVIIRPGRHNTFFLTNVNGATSAPITFLGQPGAIIDMETGGANLGKHIDINGGSYITIEGLELIDSNLVRPTSCAGSGAGLRGGIKFNRTPGSQPAHDRPYPHHVTLRNLNIHGLRQTAILGSADFSQLLYNHIHNNGFRNTGWDVKPEAYGTYLKGRGWLIRGNRIHDNIGNGIRTGNDPSSSTTELLVDSTIENNIVYDNGGTFLHPHGRYGSADFECRPSTGGDGIVVWHGSGNIIRNNIVYNNIGYGIRVNENTTLGSTPNVVYNNTVYKNGYRGIYCYAGERTIVKNNISYLSGHENIFSGCTNQLSNNLTTDPGFVNAAGRDFHVNPGSPAIDAGMTLAEVTNDFAYGVRPWPAGGAYDIGAYEFGSPPGSGPSPPPPSGVPPAIPRPPSTYDPGGRLCPI